MECYAVSVKYKIHLLNVVIEFFQLQHFANVSHRNIRQDKRLTYKVKTNAECTIIITCSYTILLL